jgi:RNA polymerase sigma-70 factor (ECF subfamily)
VELEEHLFRREAGRLVAILTRLFGLENLALAEDVVQEAFCRALETWKFHGAPANPSAWLMTTARNRALDVLRRDATARRFAPEIARELESEWTRAGAVDEAFEPGGLNDAQLAMMFSCADPRLPEETRVALILNLLCGFSVGETAAAFLKGEAAMEKRLVRGKKTLGSSRRLFELGAGHAVGERLPAVLRALYLLFNEGYHGASPEAAVRVELCREALRLVGLLLENTRTATPAARALAALLSFNLARLPARLDTAGNLLLLAEQDRLRWDPALLARGRRELERSASGDELTPYHLEAAIASVHAEARSAQETDWRAIVSLYDTLMAIQPSPVVALNRAIAIAQRDGPARGLAEISRIADRDRLRAYPFFFTAIAEFESKIGHWQAARQALDDALKVARNPAERAFLQRRLREHASACGTTS